MNQYEFSDRLDANDDLLEDVVERYTNLKIASMDHEDLVEFVKNRYRQWYSGAGGDVVTDLMVQEFPGELKSEFGVDII